MPTAHFKSDYRSEKLLKYFVKIMGDLVERKGAMASQIPESIH
jgi:hypothetical protein